jgi:hypothetical protein
MSNELFKKSLLLSSAPLIKIDALGNPAGTGSGALIDYRGKRILLTVSHVTGDQQNWTIQLRYVPGQGTVHQRLGAMHFLAKGSLARPSGDLEDVDFAYVEVPGDLTAYRQDIDPAGNRIKAELPITVHQPALSKQPSPDRQYGFCGMVMAARETHFGQDYLGGNLPVYCGLKFLRTDDDYHVFSLPFAHSGHEHFKGCSGAPVMSDTGEIVALVSGGGTSSNEIYAISLSLLPPTGLLSIF